MTVPGKYQTLERTAPHGLERTGHCCRGFSCTDQDRTPANRRGKPMLESPIRVGRRDGGIEQCSQQSPRLRVIELCHIAIPSCQFGRHFISSPTEMPALDPLHGRGRV